MGPPVRRRQEDDRERFMEIKYILVTKKFEIRMSMYAVHYTVSTPVDKKLEILIIFTYSILHVETDKLEESF